VIYPKKENIQLCQYVNHVLPLRGVIYTFLWLDVRISLFYRPIKFILIINRHVHIEINIIQAIHGKRLFGDKMDIEETRSNKGKGKEIADRPVKYDKEHLPWYYYYFYYIV
jgi:hypothetical protein